VLFVADTIESVRFHCASVARIPAKISRSGRWDLVLKQFEPSFPGPQLDFGGVLPLNTQ